MLSVCVSGSLKFQRIPNLVHLPNILVNVNNKTIISSHQCFGNLYIKHTHLYIFLICPIVYPLISDKSIFNVNNGFLSD